MGRMGGGRAVFSQGVRGLMRERERERERERQRETFKHIFKSPDKNNVFFAWYNGIRY